MAEYVLVNNKCPTCETQLMEVELSSAMRRASTIPVDQWELQGNWRQLLCTHYVGLSIDNGGASPPTIKLVSR